MSYCRCKRWVVNSRTKSLDDRSPQQLNANFLLCAEHFEPSQFMSTARSSLIHSAVPTLFNVPNPPKVLTVTRPAPPERPGPSVAKKRRTEAAAASASASVSSSSAVRGEPSTPSTPRKTELVSKLTYSRKCLARARASIFRSRTAVVHSLPSAPVCSGWCQKVDKLPAAVKQFVSSQINAASVSPFGVRWSHQDKLLALGLYYKSPSAYRFMRHAFRLPTVRTLRTFLSGFSVAVGFDCDYMLALTKRVESLNPSEKFVVVTFDGMSLRNSLKYLEHDDRIVGFEDFGEFGSASVNPAKNALQFMVRGISSRWKQPIGHFFSTTSVNSDVLKSMIVTLVSKLEAINLNVVAIVCDQESSHRQCLTNMGVTLSSPMFTSDTGNDIHVMYDPPHLIKNVRNNLLKYDIIIGNDVVSFDHISALFDLEEASVLRFVPKLTRSHIELNAFKRMNVKLATQVLSHSVASAIRTYIALNKMSTDAHATADFVEKINRIFDIMNSNKVIMRNRWKRALTLKATDQFAELKAFCEWANQWQFRSKKNSKIVKKTLPFKDGLMMTCNALHEVCMNLLAKHNFRFVLTSRFNQDIVENWFSCIRGKGRNNDSRTTVEYESASKNIAVNWMLERPQKGANCELDFDSFVGLLTEAQQRRCDTRTPATRTAAGSDADAPAVPALTSAAAPSDVSADCDLDDVDVNADWCQLFTLSSVDQNVVCYIAGYICAKLNRRLSCPTCTATYIASKEKQKSSTALHTILTHARQFDWAKYGLTVPSPGLYEICSAMERVVQMNIEGVMAGPSVMRCLTDVIRASVNLESYNVDCCCSEHQQYWLNHAVAMYLRVRIHHFVKVRNRELKQLAEKQKEKKHRPKPSRKTKKVKHL